MADVQQLAVEVAVAPRGALPADQPLQLVAVCHRLRASVIPPAAFARWRSPGPTSPPASPPRLVAAREGVEPEARHIQRQGLPRPGDDRIHADPRLEADPHPRLHRAQSVVRMGRLLPVDDRPQPLALGLADAASGRQHHAEQMRLVRKDRLAERRRVLGPGLGQHQLAHDGGLGRVRDHRPVRPGGHQAGVESEPALGVELPDPALPIGLEDLRADPGLPLDRLAQSRPGPAPGVDPVGLGDQVPQPGLGPVQGHLDREVQCDPGREPGDPVGLGGRRVEAAGHVLRGRSPDRSARSGTRRVDGAGSRRGRRRGNRRRAAPPSSSGRRSPRALGRGSGRFAGRRS